MKKFAWTFALALALPACGGDDPADPDPDAAPDSEIPGFATPENTLLAWSESGGVFTEIGPADFSCLNTPSGDAPTELEVTVTGDVNDFQDGDDVPNAAVEAFPGIEVGNPFAQVTADGTGAYSLAVPVGQERVGFKVSAAGALDTYLLNQIFDPNEADQSLGLDSVSEATATTVAALVGVQRSTERGVLAAAIRDCNNNEVSEAIATVSSTSGQPDHLEGAESFYFSPATGLPANNNTIFATSENGLFVVLELPESSQAFLQVWGFLDGQDPANDDLTLLAELPAPVLPNTVITASMEPLRQ